VTSDDLLAFDRKKAVVAVGLALALAVGAFGLVGKIADYGQLKHAVADGGRAWFPLALAGEVLAYVGYVLAYRDVASVDGGPRLPFWTVVRIVGLGFGAFVVGSAAGGLAVDFWALRRTGLENHDAARRVLALNTLEWAVLAWLAALSACLVLLGRGAGAPLAMTFTWLVVVPLCTLAAIWVGRPERLERLSRLGRGDDGIVAKAQRGFADAIGSVGLVKRIVLHPRRHPGGLLGFPLYWAGDLITIYAGLRAFGADVQPAPLVLGYATAYVVTALPLPAGGAGSLEVVLALSLHAVGVPLAPALLAAFLYRVFSFWLPIVPALLLLPTAPKLAGDLPQSRRPADRPGRKP
jgi:undecaprenyl-diphosphatase